MDLCMPSLLMYSLNSFSSTNDTSYLLQTFPLVSGTWDSWRLALLLKTEAKKAFSLSCVTGTPAPFSSKLTFSLAFLLSPMYLKKPFLLPLTSLTRFNSKWAFSFPNCTSAQSGNASVFFPSYLSIFPPSVDFRFIFVLPGAPCSFMESSWHFCVNSCSMAWTALDLAGRNHWILTSFLESLFSPGPDPIRH